MKGKEGQERGMTLFSHNPAIDFSDVWGPLFQQDAMELGYRVASWLEEENVYPQWWRINDYLP